MALPTSLLWFLLLCNGGAVADLAPIKAKGSKFFKADGTQFFINGVAYQQQVGAAGAISKQSTGYIDPLADEALCKRDVPLLKELGTNTIRTYAIDPTADHSACMRLLQDAGIYVISDLGEPNLSINRQDPQWNSQLFTRYKNVIDELAQYPNVIGFFAGNEVSDRENTTGASAYVKAAVRDTKKYIKDNANIKRWIGVGYAANDKSEIVKEASKYFACGDAEDSVDFWGYNIYSWCLESTMQLSSYEKHVEEYRNYPVPVFFAEYGCNQPSGAEARIFQETGALYSDQMTGVFSGGIVYMYFQEENDYGLVKVSNGQVQKMKNFEALKTEVLKAQPKGADMAAYSPSGSTPECPAVSSNWSANSLLPPTPNESLCRCMVRTRTCVPRKDLSKEKFGDIFSYVCGKDKSACAGIMGDTKTGVFGAYSMCDEEAKLAHVLDAYYKNQKSQAFACDFGGSAMIQTPESESSCETALAEATSKADPKKSDAAFRATGFWLLVQVAVGVYLVQALGEQTLLFLAS